MGIPGRVTFEHDIEESEQLVYGGNQGDFCRFIAIVQALIESTQCRLMTNRGQGRHIESQYAPPHHRRGSCLGRATLRFGGRNGAIPAKAAISR
jgi:hypothetical protein